ncbi:hypothetical protein [Citricoccus sp. NR2]|uniref:hypothetical protein n=1 Tax=Citricoccus sp. NR2 TaxID=3004095 RepID=UPI0022DE2B5C|nr:hypothetical protein [Citricoccus sp. NR2]WBL18678.1 hypothetical protein O1A05_13105 [Citricoccus sp. NR2]
MRIDTSKARRSLCDDSGSATVEFTVLAVVLLIPVLYFMILAGQIQSAGYASLAAADQAASAMKNAPDEETGRIRAGHALEVTTTDYGFDLANVELSMDCAPASCDESGSVVSATVEIRVDLPLVPTILSNETTVARVSSSAYERIGEFE